MLCRFRYTISTLTYVAVKQHESKAHAVIDSLGLFLVGSRERANILQAKHNDGCRHGVNIIFLELS